MIRCKSKQILFIFLKNTHILFAFFIVRSPNCQMNQWENISEKKELFSELAYNFINYNSNDFSHNLYFFSILFNVLIFPELLKL